LKTRFHRISIFAETRKPGREQMARRIVDRLRAEGCEISLSWELRVALGETPAGCVDQDDWERFLQTDLVLCIGGDGTILRVAREAAECSNPPCLCGVNAGRLGFLTAVPDEGLDSFLEDLLRGSHTIQSRALLRVEHVRGDLPLYNKHVLNDVVISSSAEVSRMLHLDMRIEGRETVIYGCDGLIFSTPTGSTAHALSAGGPIVTPTMSAVIVAPICAHTLSNRPLVLSEEETIEVYSPMKDQRIHVVLDGQLSWSFEQDDSLRMSLSRRRLPLLFGASWNSFAVLKRKLHWCGRMIGDEWNVRTS